MKSGDVDEPSQHRTEDLLDAFLSRVGQPDAEALEVFLDAELADSRVDNQHLRHDVRSLWSQMLRMNALESHLDLGPVDTRVAFHSSATRRLDAVIEGLDAYRPVHWPFGEEQLIGRGGLGEVVATVERSTGRRVALKRPRVAASAVDSPENRRVVQERLLEESRILAALSHPAIPPLIQRAVDEEGEPYFTMALIEGEDFTEAIKDAHSTGARWTQARLIEALVTVAEAVGHAHGRNIIHRDLKPANLRVTSEGQPFVLDWGLARDLRRPDTIQASVDSDVDIHAKPDGITSHRDVVGTPLYMPPEQRRAGMADVDERSDVFALGAILHHALVGRPPAPGTDDGNPADTSALRSAPAPLASICLRALSPEPEDRYASAGAFAEDLRAFLDQRVVVAYMTGAAAELSAWVRRNRGTAAALALVAAVIVTLVAIGPGFALKRDVVDARAFHRAGWNAEFGQGDFESARQLYEASIQSAPWLGLADVDLLRLVRPDAIETLVGHAAEHDAATASLFLDATNRLSGVGLNDAWLRLNEAAVARFPNDPRLLYQLARCLEVRDEDLDRRIELYRTADAADRRAPQNRKLLTPDQRFNALNSTPGQRFNALNNLGAELQKRAEAAEAAGDTVLQQQLNEEALDVLTRCDELSRSIGDASKMARSAYMLGLAQLNVHALDEGVTLLERALSFGSPEAAAILPSVIDWFESDGVSEDERRQLLPRLQALLPGGR